MNDAIGTWDFDGETGMVEVGPEGAAPGGLPLPAGHVPPLPLLDHVHPDDREGLSGAVRAWLENGSPVLRHVFRIGNEQSGWAWIQIMGRKGSGGRLLSGTWADVTEDKLAGARKEEAVTRIHQFAAAASHDLIGPLRHIAMYGDLLIDDFGTGATEEKRQMLRAMSDKARSLQILTKRLIAFSTDTSAPEFLAVPIEHVVQNVRRRLADEISTAGATVSAQELPVVVGDPVLIEKVFDNLLRNALQWRGTEPLLVTVEARQVGRSASITISDNGTGVDPRYATRIFDAFWSVPRPGGEKGAGLGLAVCKTIVNALGGDITLSSSTPEGSTFEIRLPLAR